MIFQSSFREIVVRMRMKRAAFFRIDIISNRREVVSNGQINRHHRKRISTNIFYSNIFESPFICFASIVICCLLAANTLSNFVRNSSASGALYKAFLVCVDIEIITHSHTPCAAALYAAAAGSPSSSSHVWPKMCVQNMEFINLTS